MWITSWLTAERLSITNLRIVDIGTSGDQIRVLAGAAAHLASALDVLSLSGCNWFTADLVEMLAVIDGQIATLQELADGGSSPRLSA
jgi:hypothetical protein